MGKNNSRKIIPISDTQAAIGAGVILFFFVIWALIAGVGEDFVCWIGGKDNLSGWVQAVGSIVAILSGFYVADRTLRVQNEQQLCRDLEARRCKERIQYCVLADLFEATEAWGKEMVRTISGRDTYSIDSSIYTGKSVVDSLRSVSNDQLPAVESIRRINMAVLSAEAVIAALLVLKELEGESAINARKTVRFRADRLRKIASVDKDFCNKEAENISTSEEVLKRKETEESRARALTELFSK